MTVLTGFMTGKGGSGKSTFAINLAIQHLSEGKRVLILDLDPQASITNWNYVRQNQDDAIDGLVVLNQANNNIDDVMQAMQFDNFDEVLIDLPGADNANFRRIFDYIDHCVIPVKGSGFDRLEVGETLDVIDRGIELQIKKGRQLSASMVMNMARARSVAVREARREYQELTRYAIMCESEIGNLDDVALSVDWGLTAMEFEPGGKGAYQFLELSRELKAQRGIQ